MLVSVSMVLFVAMAVLAIDLAWVYLQEGVLQKGVNAAAIAAANRAFAGSTDVQVRQSARAFASSAGLSLADGDVQLDPLTGNRRLVRVLRSMPVSLFFGPLLGARETAVGYDVYALANQDVTLLYSSPPAPFAASGIVPLYVPHADLYPILRGTVTTRAQLASLIFQPGQTFTVGQRYLLKTGQDFKLKIQDIVAMGSSQQGGLRLPGQKSGADAWLDWFKNGSGARVSIGDVLDTETGTFQGPVQDAVTYRHAQDPSSVFEGSTRTARPLSSRMVIVPIANAYVSGLTDAGTGVADLRNIGAIWNGKLSVQVIGLGQFFLDAYSTAEGQGVVTGTFVGYVGKPPNGQSAGL